MLAGLVCAQTFLVDFTRKYLLIEMGLLIIKLLLVCPM